MSSVGSSVATRNEERREERPLSSGENGKNPRRVWVQNVDVSVSLLQARLDALAARRNATEELLQRPAADPASAAANDAALQQLRAEHAIDEHVRELLSKARNAAHRRDPVPNRIINWWGGRLIEASYQ